MRPRRTLLTPRSAPSPGTRWPPRSVLLVLGGAGGVILVVLFGLLAQSYTDLLRLQVSSTTSGTGGPAPPSAPDYNPTGYKRSFTWTFDDAQRRTGQFGITGERNLPPASGPRGTITYSGTYAVTEHWAWSAPTGWAMTDRTGTRTAGEEETGPNYLRQDVEHFQVLTDGDRKERLDHVLQSAEARKTETREVVTERDQKWTEYYGEGGTLVKKEGVEREETTSSEISDGQRTKRYQVTTVHWSGPVDWTKKLTTTQEETASGGTKQRAATDDQTDTREFYASGELRRKGIQEQSRADGFYTNGSPASHSESKYESASNYDSDGSLTSFGSRWRTLRQEWYTPEMSPSGALFHSDATASSIGAAAPTGTFDRTTFYRTDGTPEEFRAEVQYPGASGPLTDSLTLAWDGAGKLTSSDTNMTGDLKRDYANIYAAEERWFEQKPPGDGYPFFPEVEAGAASS